MKSFAQRRVPEVVEVSVEEGGGEALVGVLVVGADEEEVSRKLSVEYDPMVPSA